MPSRKIPRSYRSFTGRCWSAIAGDLVPFESGLERDLIIAADFLPGAYYLEAQPIKIQLGPKTYHPDYLLGFRSFPYPVHNFEILIEVKPSSELEKHAEKLSQSFELGLAYAQSRGWRFKVLTEAEIRADPLPTLRFLRSYLVAPELPQIEGALREELRHQPKPVYAVAHAISKALRIRPLYAWRSIWRLLATSELAFESRLLSPVGRVALRVRAPETYWSPSRPLLQALEAPWEIRP